MLKSLDLEDETYRTQYIKPHAAEEITMLKILTFNLTGLYT